VNHKTTNSQTC